MENENFNNPGTPENTQPEGYIPPEPEAPQPEPIQPDEIIPAQPEQQYNGYSAPNGAAPINIPPQEGSKVLSIVSMVLGIVSILICCCYGIGVLFGGGAIVTGAIAKKKDLPGGGMALAGIITGAVGVVAGIVMLILIIVGVAADYSNYY